MHLDAGQVQAVLHGERPADAFAAVDAHLDGCAACQRAVARARADEREIYELLGRIDLPHRPGRLEVATEKGRRRSAMPSMRWAAGIVLMVGVAGVAMAVPSSPLRQWLQGRQRARERAAIPTPAPTATPAATPAADVAGIRVLPGTSMQITFAAPQSSGEMRIQLVDGDDIDLRAASGTVTYAVGTGLLRIENEGATTSYILRISRIAPSVQVQVAGRRVWSKEGARVVSQYQPDADGIVRIPVER